MRIEYASRRSSPRKNGPYSRRLKRGAISDAFDGRSTEGRYIRDLEKQLTEHIGGNPTITQKLLIQRIIELRMRLDAFDYKLKNEPEKWTGHDDRTYGGCQNAFRLALKDLGHQPYKPEIKSGEDVVRMLRGQKPANREAAE